MVSAIEGGPAKPRDKRKLIVEAGVRGAPTLVQNVETLAHIALIARHGPTWFRERGTDDVSEFDVVQEDVRFMLPKEIRRELAARS